MKFNDDIQSGIDWKIDRLSNRKNGNMNELLSVDHANRDWLDDSDLMLPRLT